MQYWLETFGCQMNEHDSEVIAGFLEEMGYWLAVSPNNADIIMINTCCVRNTAENKVYGLLGRLRRLKAENPQLIIGVCGCMTQQQGIAEKIKRRFPYIDIIIGTHNIQQLPVLLQKLLDTGEPITEVWAKEKEINESLQIKRKDGIKAWVTIMYGCNNYCTYCIVPYVRGRERSRRPDEIIAEVKQLGQEGCKEVTLLGQNVSSYGKGLNSDFADLLTALNKIKGIERIRYLTSHPRDFSDRLIKVIALSQKVCEHFHLPVQSGSNHVLHLMNRGYSREEYLRLVEKIRKSIPGACITTDIMVGFPGETDDDFKDTLDLVQQVRFDSAYTFIYNKRTGTPAAGMTDQVPEAAKKERIETLIAMQNDISLEKNKAAKGQAHEVLVEGESKSSPVFLCGRNRCNKMVIFPGDKNIIGNMRMIKITDGQLTHLKGTLL
ncbi:MAG: tRNA (N6-isopentenyl adenosine(37)-C2)-methylthiotransferase MiaB [Peptococcaceae bacterium]|nr:MAG: tRNA (N6-isopentenyl adenosine(37)-C2)-methylthiotransferase MiaB [Peptococcaceae bacterium]